MAVIQHFDEIRVFADIAERTGVQLERSIVRRSGGCCRSITELFSKARAAGEGTFYLPLNLWPAAIVQLELRKPWVVMS